MASTIQEGSTAKAYQFNKKSAEHDKADFGNVVFLNKLRAVKGTYSFAVQGGAVGNIAFKDELGNSLKLPSGAFVVQAILDVTTSFTSGGSATVGIASNASGDIVAAATAVASWDAAVSTVSVVPFFAAATAYKKLTAERTINLEVGVAALTAGVCSLYVIYLEP